MSIRLLFLFAPFVPVIAGFDNSRYDNVAVYWGQNSHGASNPGDTANYQQPISFYCQDNAVDVFPVAFLTRYPSTGGLPEINLANICNNKDNSSFPGSALADCSAVAPEMKACQANGKILTLSIGGAGGGITLSSDRDGEMFADLIWDSFLGGTSSKRPFGDAVLDGVDLDIESGGSAGYVAFVNRIRSYANGASKQYYITAAPQCVFPDASLSSVLNAVSFDAVYVQFYNNLCGLQNIDLGGNFNFGQWDYWARNTSPNKDVKIYLGAPAAQGAAGGGYIDIGTLSKIATKMRNSFPSFGGVMMWDVSQAFANGRYDLGIKDALVGAGGIGFTFPACTAPAYVAGKVYASSNELVSYEGYIWTNKYWTQATPGHSTYDDWTPGESGVFAVDRRDGTDGDGQWVRVVEAVGSGRVDP